MAHSSRSPAPARSGRFARRANVGIQGGLGAAIAAPFSLPNPKCLTSTSYLWGGRQHYECSGFKQVEDAPELCGRANLAIAYKLPGSAAARIGARLILNLSRLRHWWRSCRRREQGAAVRRVRLRLWPANPDKDTGRPISFGSRAQGIDRHPGRCYSAKIWASTRLAKITGLAKRGRVAAINVTRSRPGRRMPCSERTRPRWKSSG